MAIGEESIRPEAKAPEPGADRSVGHELDLFGLRTDRFLEASAGLSFIYQGCVPVGQMGLNPSPAERTRGGELPALAEPVAIRRQFKACQQRPAMNSKCYLVHAERVPAE